MGFNATLIVLLDALGEIEKDKDFGKNVAEAISRVSLRPQKNMVDIRSGNHLNAASVVESHHADSTVVLAVGGNCGSVLATTYGWQHTDKLFRERLLRQMADEAGFRLVRKTAKGE